MKQRLWIALLVLALALGGCSLLPPPYVPPPPESDPVWDFVAACQIPAWTYEADVPGELCQDPDVSMRRMAGDCDDFAVMVACTVQEIFHVDTFIVRINIQGTGNHLCAFVKSSTAEAARLSGNCSRPSDYPMMTLNSFMYVAADMHPCPGWIWTHWGQPISRVFEWNELVGLPI
jgi:hypothetical protein